MACMEYWCKCGWHDMNNLDMKQCPECGSKQINKAFDELPEVETC